MTDTAMAQHTGPAPRKILIIRLSALGDVVMASGLIPALSARFPQAELYWLNEGPAVPLLAHNPRIKEVLIFPKERLKQLWRARQWAPLWRELRAFAQMLRAHRFDLVLDAQGLLKSGLCAWMTAAPRRIGIISREGSRWLMHEVLRPPVGADLRMGAEYRHLACHLGAAESDFQPDLAVGAAPRATAQRVLAELTPAAQAGRPLVVLCPFTTRPQKHWVESRWAELAAALHAQGWQPAILGGPADLEAAQRIASAYPGLINLAGRLKLDETVAAIAQSRLLIGVDTGLTHMGSALSVPTVALFGATRPYLQAALPAPGAPATTTTHVMYDALACSPCRRSPTCGGRFDCMQQLTLDRVLREVRALAPVGGPA